MNTLAFDTCFGACSVALTWREAGGEARVRGAFRFEIMERGHAERLIPMIGEAVGDAPFGLPEVARIAVTTGPGTFTGQRVGIAAARALALVTGAALGGVSSLAVMAHTAVAQLGAEARCDTLAVAVDARRGELYFQAFQAPFWREVATPVLTTPEDAASSLAAAGKAVVVGSGAQLVAAAAQARGTTLAFRLAALQPDMRFAPIETIAFGSAPVRPLYLRPPDAKPQDGALVPRAS